MHIYRDGKLTEIYTAEELSNKVYESVQYYQRKAEDAHTQMEKALSDARAIVQNEYEEENKSLKQRLSLSYGRFASEKEKQAYIDFMQRHMHNRRTSRANGGKAPYLIPNYTGLGTILRVKCQICGAEEDITDMEAW